MELFFWTSSSEELKEGKTARREKNDIISYEIYTSQCNWLMLYQLYVIACTYQSLDEINFSGVSFAGNDVF